MSPPPSSNYSAHERYILVIIAHPIPSIIPLVAAFFLDVYHTFSRITGESSAMPWRATQKVRRVQRF